MLKKTKVVMLPTNQKAAFFTSIEHPEFAQKGDNTVKNPYWQGHHLYFLPWDSLEVGDIAMNMYNNTYTIFRITKVLKDGYEGQKLNDTYAFYTLGKTLRKIIATTDSSLRTLPKEPNLGSYVSFSLGLSLPQPSQAFITSFIKEYNSGNVITDVMVEYESYHGINTSIAEINAVSGDNSMNWNGEDRDFKLKVNSKDNTITIKPLKNIWTRDEVVKLFSKAFSSDLVNTQSASQLDKWIEENLI